MVISLTRPAWHQLPNGSLVGGPPFSLPKFVIQGPPSVNSVAVGHGSFNTRNWLRFGHWISGLTGQISAGDAQSCETSWNRESEMQSCCLLAANACKGFRLLALRRTKFPVLWRCGGRKFPQEHQKRSKKIKNPIGHEAKNPKK